ncbi:MAG: hypothetical protein JL57_20080 [Desulfosporosinus sp. BICA1-9]|nr:MAG: hypothetical protein JL57_20080 [Desulfosporosinus sp. BICA1-9]
MLQKSRNRQKQTLQANKRVTRLEVYTPPKAPERLLDTEKGYVAKKHPKKGYSTSLVPSGVGFQDLLLGCSGA